MFGKLSTAVTNLCLLIYVCVAPCWSLLGRCVARGDVDECPASELEKFSRPLIIYTYVESTGYRLKLCSATYENAPKCSTFMGKIKIFRGGTLRPHIHYRVSFDVLFRLK